MEPVHHIFDDDFVVFETPIRYLDCICGGDDKSVFWSQQNTFTNRIMRSQGLNEVSRQLFKATSLRHGQFHRIKSTPIMGGSLPCCKVVDKSIVLSVGECWDDREYSRCTPRKVVEVEDSRTNSSASKNHRSTLRITSVRHSSTGKRRYSTLRYSTSHQETKDSNQHIGKTWHQSWKPSRRISSSPLSSSSALCISADLCDCRSSLSRLALRFTVLFFPPLFGSDDVLVAHYFRAARDGRTQRRTRHPLVVLLERRLVFVQQQLHSANALWASCSAR